MFIRGVEIQFKRFQIWCVITWKKWKNSVLLVEGILGNGRKSYVHMYTCTYEYDIGTGDKRLIKAARDSWEWQCQQTAAVSYGLMKTKILPLLYAVDICHLLAW
jgi:hypothetical protein